MYILPAENKHDWIYVYHSLKGVKFPLDLEYIVLRLYIKYIHIPTVFIIRTNIGYNNSPKPTP